MEISSDAPAICAVRHQAPTVLDSGPTPMVFRLLQMESQFTTRCIAAELQGTTTWSLASHRKWRAKYAICWSLHLQRTRTQRSDSCSSDHLMPSEPQRLQQLLQQLLHDTKIRELDVMLRHMRLLLHTAGATTADADSRLLRELFIQ
ncbi:hypothetical protein MRX96_059110 [Rhipicephalus microplus]